MKKFYKLLSVILALILLFTALPFNAYAKTKAPAKPTAISSVSETTAITLKWKKVKGAKGYKVYQYNTKNKKYTLKATTSKTSQKLTKLKVGTTYVYAVKSYKVAKKKKYYSAYSAKHTTSTLPDKVKSIKCNLKGACKAELSWSAVSGADSYKLYIADNSSFKNAKTVTVKGKTTYTAELNPNTKYYFNVYAIRTVAKKSYVSSVASNVANVTTKACTKIYTDKKHQTITGFGASGAWWAQKVGGWENADDFLRLLYSKDEGIGLNIYRYNLGAGTDTDEHVKRGARAETFMTDVEYIHKGNLGWDEFNISYDWTRDKNARNALSLANKYSDDLQVVLFANSPPKHITINGKGYCSYHEDGYWDDDGFHKVDSYKTNLSRDNFSIYAKYLTDCADHFISEGYNVVDISPVNEPQYAWSCDANGNMSQEGCYYTPDDMAKLFSRMVTYGKGKPYKFSMFESCGVSGTLWNPDYMYQDCFDAYINPIFKDNRPNKEYYDSVSVHSYWNNKEDKQRFKERMNEYYPNLKIACTEYCQMTNDTNTGVWDLQQTLHDFDFNGMGIEHGIQLARTVYEDLTVLDATEWNWWTGVSGGYYPDGLVYYDGPPLFEYTDDGTEIDHAWDTDAREVYTSKRLWCLGNFSKFIRKGAVRMETSDKSDDLLSCAFLNKDGSLVIVYINLGDADVETAASATSKSFNTADVYLTSECCDLEHILSTKYDSNQLFTIPSKSVVSVILTNKGA